MRIACQTFCLPKAGRSFVDCEDAYFPAEVNCTQLYEVAEEGVELFRASVSDGATDSIFSKLWAQLLAFGYGSGKWESDITAESVKEEQNAWLDFLAKQQLPWYAEEKAELGAFAAFVGLTLYDRSKRWSAMAVGDCCLFQVRDGECISAFPISSSSTFSNFPLLLCSVAERNANVFESKKGISDGSWQSGDLFLLMSDTVASWFLAQMESGLTRSIIESIDSIRSLDAFVSLVSHARATKGGDGNVLMRDDDVTVTLVRVVDDRSAPLPRKFSKDALSAAVKPTVELPKPNIAKGAQDLKASMELDPVLDYRSSSPGGENPVPDGASARGSYATRMRTPKNGSQPDLIMVICAVVIVAVCAVSVAAMFASKKTDQQNRPDHKVESVVSTESAVAPSNVGKGPVQKTSGAHRHGKQNDPGQDHSARKKDGGPNTANDGTHTKIDGAQTTENGGAHTKNSGSNTGNDGTHTKINGAQTENGGAYTKNSGAQTKNGGLPSIAPDHASQSRSSSDQSHMPAPAPDRNSAIPVPLPEHVHQDHGGVERIPSIGGFRQRGRSANHSAGAVGVGQPREKINSDPNKSDMPEDLKN